MIFFGLKRSGVGAAIAAVALLSVVGASGMPSLADGRPRIVSDRRPAETTLVGAAAIVPAGAVELGPASATGRVALEIALKPGDVKALNAFLRRVNDPASRQYRHYLAKGQFGRRFGPTPRTVAAVELALAHAGLRVGRVSASGLLIPVSTTVRGAERAFHVSLRRYRLASRAVVIANSGAPRLPRSIASGVQAVVGLDGLAQPLPADVTVATPGAMSAAGRTRRPEPHANLPAGEPQACTAGSDLLGQTADEIATAYELQPLYASGDFGAGESVDVIEVSGFSATNVDAYESCYGIQVPVVPKPEGGGPSTGSSTTPPPSTVEADGDIEDIAGLAPRLTRINVYEVPRTPSGVLAGYSAIQADDAADVVTSSVGFCEPVAIATGLIAAENTIFKAMAAQGQTVFAAAGDQGDEACNVGTAATTELAVDDPASQPYVVGVGGTNLSSSGAPPGWPPIETAWNRGGGGISSIYPISTWQLPSTPGVISSYSSGTPCGLSSGHDCREVPDVSADAGACFNLYLTGPSGSGEWSCATGTSYASPAWAAIMALIDDSSPTCRVKPVGFISARLYQLAASTPADFNDITSGNNDPYGTHGVTYPATPGYDMVTGLGSPEAANLAQSLCGTTEWTPAADSSNFELTESPSIAFSGDTMYAAGVDNTPADAPGVVYYGLDNGEAWSYPSDAEVGPAGQLASTDEPAAIAVVNGNPIVAWTDFTTGKVETSTLLAGHWSSPAVVGAGDALSSAGPALAAFGGSVFAAWKGKATTDVWISIDNGGGWQAQLEVPGSDTNLRPAITYAPQTGSIVIAWTTPSNRIEYEVYSLLLGDTFLDTTTIPGESSVSGPALTVVASDRLFEAHTGSTDNDVYYSSLPAGKLVGTWSNDQPIPASNTQFSPALAGNGPTLFAGWRITCSGCASPLYTSETDPP